MSVSAREGADRRAALLGLSAAAGMLFAKPSIAAYGETANIFGKPTNTSGFIPYKSDEFSFLLPSKWKPSGLADVKNTIVSYEDNQEPITKVTIFTLPTDKKSIEQIGSPEDFLRVLQSIGLFGKQVYTGTSRSEGGFAEGRYAAASLIDTKTESDKAGKKYYKYDLLTRFADGNEGGRHQLISAAVGANGKVYVQLVQCGEKRWFYGADKPVIGAHESFIVA